MLYAVGSVIILSCAILWGYGGLAAGTVRLCFLINFYEKCCRLYEI